jgi:acyl-CoA thioesterase-2
MSQGRLDLSRVFELEPHGPDTYVGESPRYEWGRIYGGLVVAQALRAAVYTVQAEHAVHSLHAYFILGGDLAEPVRYEVDRVRNGRSFTTRRVVARQSAGAILTLECSFQRAEDGPDTQSADMPAGVPDPTALTPSWDAGIERCDFARPKTEPGSMTWVRFPNLLRRDRLTGAAPPEPGGGLRRDRLTGAAPSEPGGGLRRERLADAEPPEPGRGARDPAEAALHCCALAYLSDMNAMDAITASGVPRPVSQPAWGEGWMGVSLDHAVWFHRPVRSDDWLLLDFTGHGLIRTRGLATGLVFDRRGTHVATIAQEGLLRTRIPSAG